MLDRASNDVHEEIPHYVGYCQIFMNSYLIGVHSVTVFVEKYDDEQFTGL